MESTATNRGKVWYPKKSLATLLSKRGFEVNFLFGKKIQRPIRQLMQINCSLSRKGPNPVSNYLALNDTCSHVHSQYW